MIETIDSYSVVRTDSCQKSAVNVTLPWVANPCSLLTWWDMERFSAEAFYVIGSYLAGVRCHLEHSGVDIATVHDGQQSESKMHTTMGGVQRRCESIGLTVSSKHIKSFLSNLGEEAKVADVIASLSHIEKIIRFEMEDRLFMFVPSDKAEFYKRPEQLFGEEVISSFPSTTTDIEESGKCYATGRNIACVFHLMRVIEVGLRSFAKTLHEPRLDPTTNPSWEKILKRGDEELAKHPKDRSA